MRRCSVTHLCSLLQTELKQKQLDDVLIKGYILRPACISS